MNLLDIYDSNCSLCKLSGSSNCEDVCVPGSLIGPHADIMVVGKMPISQRQQRSIGDDLDALGISRNRLFFTSALKCKNYEDNAGNLQVKSCRPYLLQEISRIKPKYILTMGNEALFSVTGHSGITKYRGRPEEHHGAMVVPTISPAAVRARPQNLPGYEADLRFFANLVKGVASKIPTIAYKIISTREDLDNLVKDLRCAQVISFDIESTICPLQEFDPRARIISLAGTYTILDTKNGWIDIRGFAIPLFHPQSPWRTRWRAVIRYLAEFFRRIPKRIAWNGKFDCRWLRQFGMDDLDITFDPMLAVHLLDENVLKGLKPQAQQRLGVGPWAEDVRDLLDMPIEKVLEYNFLDTYYTYLVYLQVKAELIEKPRLLRIFLKIIMPSANNLIGVERRGVWIDKVRLAERTPIAIEKLRAIENGIRDYLPLRGEAYPETEKIWPKDSKGKKFLQINFNASNFARWMLFNYLELPVIERGKEKPDGSPGDPSMKEEVLLHLRELPDHHPVVDLMLERVGWQKAISSFFNAYNELADSNDRIHTNFKLSGTVTGRLSSGKTDAEKLPGARGKSRGVNLQQVPRDPFIRGLFGSTPGWTWVEADFSQIELRIAAFIANERHMIWLYSQDADIHMITAMAVTGLPKSKVTKEIRKKVGKPVNFGFLYDMGWRKFIETAFKNYGAHFTESQAQAYKKAYFELYPDLHPWHDRQRRLVKWNGQVQSPIGRVRHLPDINSPEQGVRAEAERQAINSPVQGFASDLALLGMNNILENVAKQGLEEHVNCLGLVHDAVNLEVRQGYEKRILPIIKDSMEDMKNLKRKFGVVMTLPIIADLKVGQHWGDSIELTADQVYDFPGLDRLTADH